MSWIQALALGIVQGLCEFLPVSSSGHLVLFQHLFGLTEPALLFDISLHVGTLAAVVAVFYRDLAAMAGTMVRLPGLWRQTGGPRRLLAAHANVRLIAMILVASVPTAVLGLLFARAAERFFSSVPLVGVTLIITGTFLWFTRCQKDQGRSIVDMSWRHGLLIGLAQGLAITPGISRSGATVSMALYLGVNRQTAFRFSFLLSIPAILGAFIFEINHAEFSDTVPFGMILTGCLSAAVTGFMALKALSRMVAGGRLYRFAPYCWVVGALALAASFV